MSELTFGGAFPVVVVADVRRALRFHVELPGATEVFRFPSEGDAIVDEPADQP